METKTEIRELLETYYQGFSKKANWEQVIADDFIYTGGNMDDQPMKGKDAYVEMIKQFSQRFETMKVKQMIIEGNNACVIGNYDFIFPNGKKINGNVSEIWTAQNGKLKSLNIFFDTQAFMENMKP